MIKPATPREDAVFTYWLEKRVYQRRGVSACEFKRMCDRGEIRGFTLQDIPEGTGPEESGSGPGAPISDSATVSGEPSDVESSKQRDESAPASTSKPRSAAEQRGPAERHARQGVAPDLFSGPTDHA